MAELNVISLVSEMPSGEPLSQLSARQVKDACAAHMCPQCGVDHHVTVEQVLRGNTMVTWCHCRACGHSWHPVLHGHDARES